MVDFFWNTVIFYFPLFKRIGNPTSTHGVIEEVNKIRDFQTRSLHLTVDCEKSFSFPNFSGAREGKAAMRPSSGEHNYYISARSKDLRKKDRQLAV